MHPLPPDRTIDPDSLALALAAGGEAVWSWDPDRREVDWEAALRQLRALPPLLLLAPAPGDLARLSDALQAFAAGNALRWQTRLPLRDGDGRTQRWLTVRAQAIRSPGGGARAIAGVLRDEELDAQVPGGVFLATLERALHGVDVPDEAVALAARLLGEHLHADRCVYAVIDHERQQYNIIGDHARGVDSIRGRVSWDAFGLAVLEALQRGDDFVCDDTASDPRTAGSRERFEQACIAACVAIPLQRNGRLIAAVALNQRTPRRWTAHEIELLRQVSVRCHEALERIHAAREAERQRRQLELALAAGRMGVWEWNLATGERRATRTMLELYGLDPDGEGPAPTQDFVQVLDEDRALLRDQLDKVRRGESASANVEYRIRRADDGSVRWIFARGTLVRDPDDGSERLIGVSFDTTERKQAEERLIATTALLQAVGDVTPTLLYYKDQAGRIQYCNPAVLRLIGRPLAEVIGRTDAQFSGEGERTRRIEANDRRVLCDGATIVVEERVEGSDTVYLSTKTPVRDASGRIIGLAGVSVDISEQRRIEQALRQNEDDLRRAAEALEQADRRKDEFIAMLAHELRNPLAPLFNAQYLLERSTGLGEHERSLLEMSQRQLRQLHRLVDDLLEVARIARGKVQLRPERMALADAVSHAAESLRPTLAKRRQRLSIALPEERVTLDADPQRIAQILENLLDNASKYTPPGGAIAIEAAADAGQLEIHVSDDGIGIDPSQLQSIFEPFTQIEPRVGQAQGGLGIGLSLVRQLVQMHGGSIEAYSAGRGCGSRFTLRLPRR